MAHGLRRAAWCSETDGHEEKGIGYFKGVSRSFIPSGFKAIQNTMDVIKACEGLYFFAFSKNVSTAYPIIENYAELNAAEFKHNEKSAVTRDQ